MTLSKTSPTKTRRPPPPNGNGHESGGPHDGNGAPLEPLAGPELPVSARRSSPWPFLLDLGIVLVLVGLILFRQNVLVVLGGLIAVIALINWIRQARAEYSQLPK